MKEEIYEDVRFLEFKDIKNAYDLIRDRELDSNYDKEKSYLQLKKSILNVGVLNPLILARQEDNSLELIGGRRRLSILKELINNETIKIPVKIIKKEHRHLRYEICYSDNQDRKNINNLAQLESLIIDLTVELVGYDRYRKVTQESMFVAFMLQNDVINRLRKLHIQIKNKGVIQEVDLADKENEKNYKIQKRLDSLSKNLNIEKRKLILMLLNSFSPIEKILINRGFDNSLMCKLRRHKSFKEFLQDFEIVACNIRLKNIEEIQRVLNILKKYNLEKYINILEENINLFFQDDEQTQTYKNIIDTTFKNNIINEFKDIAINQGENLIENKSKNVIKDLKKKVDKILKSDSQELIQKLQVFIENLERTESGKKHI